MKSAIYQINYGCNQDCQFCLNDWRGKSMKEIDSVNKENIIKKLNNLGITKLTLSGGEPLLDKDFKKIITLANSFGMKILIQTNGTLITRDLAGFLKNKAFLEISLEGTESVHNRITKSKNFQKAINGIKIAVAEEIPVCTNFTITKLNFGCLDEYMQLLESLNINIANFTKMYSSGNAIANINLMPSDKEHLEFFKKLAGLQNKSLILNVQPGFKKEMLKAAGIIYSNECCAGKELSISPDGSVKACPSWPFSLGNILEGFSLPELHPDACAIGEMLHEKVNKLKSYKLMEGTW